MDETTKPTKAVFAFLIAGLGALAVAAADNAITLGEAVLVASTAVAAAGAVYGVTNKPRDPEGKHEQLDPGAGSGGPDASA